MRELATTPSGLPVEWRTRTGFRPPRKRRRSSDAKVLGLPGNAALTRRTDPAPELVMRPEAERSSCYAYFDQEGAERSGEADHRRHEQDGYGSRQVE